MSMKRRQLLFAMAAAGLATAPSRNALADDVDTALKQITKARASIRTLQASFKQKRVIGLLATAVQSSGKLTLVRPDRLRWELHPPDAVTYWIGPTGLAMRNSEGVTKIGAGAAGRFAVVLNDLLIMLGGDMSKLRSRYSLTVSRDKGRTVLSATPTNKAVKKHIAQLRLIAHKQLWSVERVEIHERSGDKSLIDFAPFVRDKAVPAAHMKPPR